MVWGCGFTVKGYYALRQSLKSVVKRFYHTLGESNGQEDGGK